MCTLLSEHHSARSHSLPLSLLHSPTMQLGPKPRHSLPNPSITFRCLLLENNFFPLTLPPSPLKLVWIFIVWSGLINKTNAVRNSWLPHFINKWLVCYTLVIDRLCTGCIGTRWIQYSRSHWGELQSISAHEKLRSEWKPLKRAKFCPVAFCLLPVNKTAQRWWWITQKSEDTRFNPPLPLLFFFVPPWSLLMYASEGTLNTPPAARWRNTQPSQREPNNRGGCPETHFLSQRGVSTPIL